MGWLDILRRARGGTSRKGGRREVREMMLRAHVRVEGKVQGVYYRAHARDKATRLGVTGWVRNLPDGSVEVVIEGNEPSVRAMLEWCRNGPARAEVVRTHVTWEPYTGEFDRFSVRETPEG